jgi:hypothetical protein
MLFIIAGLMFQKKKLPLYEIFLVLVFTVFAFSARRHIPVFAIVTIPIMANVWQANITDLWHTMQINAGAGTKKYLNRVALYVNTRAEDFSVMEKKLCFHLMPVCAILIMTGISSGCPGQAQYRFE